MIRIVCDPGQRAGDRLVLTSEQTHYLERVMRQKIGDVLEVHFAGEGVHRATLLGAGELQIDPATTPVLELPTRILLYQSLLKHDHFAEIVERGTEAGIADFIPLVTDRSIVREVTPNRDQRWRKIAIEATEQCRRAEVPRIHPVASLKDIRPPEAGIGLLLDPSGLPLRTAVANHAVEVALAVGPEGGFTAEERSLLIDRGFLAVSLGPHIFRSENAGAFAAVMLLGLWMR